MTLEGILIGWVAMIVFIFIGFILKLKDGCAGYAWFVFQICIIALLVSGFPPEDEQPEIVSVGGLFLMLMLYGGTYSFLKEITGYKEEDNN